MVDCCKHTKKHKSCIRKSDKKSFKLPRKFSRKKCKNPKGFTMKSSCAPYKDCKSLKGGGSNKTHYFAGGCFWGIEKKFSELKGVSKTKVGYMGGNIKNPSYEQVSMGNTGHMETVQVISSLSLPVLLKHFFNFHDYTSLDHQGPDKGPQYRAAFFYQNPNELKTFQNFVKKYNNVKTKALPLGVFYIAEDYHQMYSFQKPCKSLKTENKTVFDKICKNNSMKAELKNTGEYLHNKIRGKYLCSCCGQILYNSINQYDSGTGWPAFSKSFNESHLLFNPKNGELRCSNCGLHLGHRTFDGPTSTKIHDCINSACLYFEKDNKKGGGKSKKLPIKKNIDNEKIQICSKKPLTGYYRDGYCMTGSDDLGTHTVCAKMDANFLQYTKKKGNDLSSVVKPGQNWCLCENRWNQAFLDGKAPKVIRNATNMRTKQSIQKNINSIKKGGGKTKKQFLYNPNDPKKSFDVYIDKNPKDTIPIKYTTLDDVKNTIKKLERLYKQGKYTHKRIWQVGMILRVRLKVLKSKKPKEYKLAERYFKHLGKRTKIKDEKKRKKFKFNLN